LTRRRASLALLIVRPSLHAFVGDRFPAAVRSLSVAVVYEDSETHRRATTVYEFLLQELDEDAQLTATWWRTSLLGDPKLSKAAARTIGSSDLIIISVQGEKPPGPLMKSWMESWPFAGGRSARLLALLFSPGASPRSDNEWDACLRDLAERRELFYLPGILEEAKPMPPGTEATSLCAPNRFIEPYQHWGLNE
jgi:hypothetical protein